MSLEVAVAAPFKQRAKERLGEGEFVVALSLDRDWFSPDQAKRLVDVAVGRGLLDAVDGDLVTQFDPDDVVIPEGFTPDESILREQSTFETALDAIVSAGVEKQRAVAGINERQRTLAVTIEAAAVLYAKEHGAPVERLAADVRDNLAEGNGGGGEEEKANGGTEEKANGGTEEKANGGTEDGADEPTGGA